MRRHFAAFAVPAASTVLVALGCSAVIDLDGLTGGHPAVDGSFDASSDVSLDGADSGTSADGASDASLDDATWCDLRSAGTLFCADFDRGPLTFKWDNLDVVNGDAGFDDTLYTSAPRSFLSSSYDLSDAGPGFDIVLSKGFQSRAATLRYAFELRFDGAPSVTGAKVAAIELATNGVTNYGVGFVLLPTGAQIEQHLPGNTPPYTYSSDLPGSPTAGGWSRIQIDLVLASSDGGAAPAKSITVSVGGNVVLDHDPITWANTQGAPTISIGLVYGAYPSSPWRVRIDDVTFDVVPAP